MRLPSSSLGCCWLDVEGVLTFPVVRMVGRAWEDRTCNKEEVFSSSSFFRLLCSSMCCICVISIYQCISFSYFSTFFKILSCSGSHFVLNQKNPTPNMNSLGAWLITFFFPICFPLHCNSYFAALILSVGSIVVLTCSSLGMFRYFAKLETKGEICMFSLSVYHLHV